MFYHTNTGVDELLLCELRDPVRKKQIVQRMTTATAQLPGSVGERRQMRQNLETLVDQKEVETSVRWDKLALGVYQLVLLLSRLRHTSGHIFMT